MTEILLVEDTEKIASFVSKGLRANGYRVTHVSSGEEALALCRSAEFDLLILDIGLPGIDGFEVIRQLRGTGYEMPIIVLTARHSVDSTVASFEEGADDYIGKPFAFEELLVRVKSRLRTRSHHVPDSHNLEVGSLSLNLLDRKATLGGVEISLTTKEYEVLEYLMRHAGQTLSREQILSGVWTYDFDPGTNVVDVYVRYLRQKLGSELIETIRGAGYKLVKP
jgi:DNA-binding response OmpR family regulator